jgi:hypothetical protein
MEQSRSGRKWLAVTIAVVLLLALGACFVIWRARTLDDFTRAWVIRELSARFESQVELEDIHVSAFPRMQVSGDGLALHYKNRTDVPPLIRIGEFTFNLGVMGIVRAPRRIAGVHVKNMTITIPPRGKNTNHAQSEQPRNKQRVPHVIIDEIVCDDTQLLILPKKEGKEPLDFKIHDLFLKSVGGSRPFDFRGSLTNAKPVGEIATRGTFGPWNAEDPGATPVSGTYAFTDADLGPFRGIGGILSSTGKYSGQLNELEVQGETQTPDFSLDPVGRGVPLFTEYSATVDGSNGDTYLHPVRATLLHSLIIANGSVIRSLEKQGRVIALDIVAPNAQLQDLLRLATKANTPVMSGMVNLKTKFLLPPGTEKVVDRLMLDGDFGVEEARFANAEVRQKLESLSRRALGQPENTDVGSAVSELRGHFHLAHGVITFRYLSFSVPGAAIRLDGTYKLRGEELNFKGHLRMRARLSQAVTGKKSLFLKLVDPFFKKNGAGAVVPISISGTRDQPKFGLALF